MRLYVSLNLSLSSSNEGWGWILSPPYRFFQESGRAGTIKHTVNSRTKGTPGNEHNKSSASPLRSPYYVAVFCVRGILQLPMHIFLSLADSAPVLETFQSYDRSRFWKNLGRFQAYTSYAWHTILAHSHQNKY